MKAKTTTKTKASAKKAPAKQAAPAKKAAPRKAPAKQKPAAKPRAVAKAAKTAKPRAAAKAAKPRAVAKVAKPRPVVKAAHAAQAAKPPMKKPAPRADLGAPVDGFFARQPPTLRPITDALRALIAEAVPTAESSIKWGMPFYTLDGGMMCAIGAHKAHVNLILSGPPGAFDDPEGRLTGDGKTGRHLKVRSVDELPEAAVRAWLATAAELARAGKTGGA